METDTFREQMLLSYIDRKLSQSPSRYFISTGNYLSKYVPPQMQLSVSQKWATNEPPTGAVKRRKTRTTVTEEDGMLLRFA